MAFIDQMKSQILLLATIFGSLALPAIGNALTLEEAVCLMLEFEPELNAAEYDTLSSKEDQKIARSELLPRVTINGSAGYSDRTRTVGGVVNNQGAVFQRQIGVSIQQLLYDGGTAKNQARASRNAFLAQQYLEKGMIEDRVVDLVEVYMEVIRTRRQVALAQRNVDNHQQMRDMLRERAAAGGSRADLALIQGRLGLAMNTLATQRLQYNLAKGRFERLTGKVPGNLSYPAIPSLPGNMDSVDLSNNHEYLAAMEAMEAAEHRANAMKGLYGPKIYLDAGVSTGRDVVGISGKDNEASALVVGSWDIFRGGYNKGMNARERFQVGKYQELLRSADIQRYYDLNVLWQERSGSVASVDAMTKYASELSSVTGDYEEQFRVGRQELMNILDVQSEYYTASSQLLNAEFDVDTSAYRILGVQGKAVEYILGPDGCERCFSGKGTIPPNWTLEKGNTDPDCRVPVTQPDLMIGRFDTDGPDAPHEDLRQKYYVEREQLPGSSQCRLQAKGWSVPPFQKAKTHWSDLQRQVILKKKPLS